ncbi:MAG: metallophosphoesterase [Clostridia bacterium]|nr:metallophosphoesterase [Clostridia bacterium]
MLFAIADAHLCLGTPDKTMEIFPGWKDYIARLEKNWRGAVGEDDVVVIAGDISWAMTLEEARPDLAFIDSLPGRKLLLRGNHDFWWTTAAKLKAFFAENGFETLSILRGNAFSVGGLTVCGSRGWFFDSEEAHDKKIIARETGRIAASLDAGDALPGENVVFLHYPPVSVNGGSNEIIELLEARGVKRVYYGHLHGEKTDRPAAAYGGPVGLRLISADHLGFCPLLIGG